MGTQVGTLIVATSLIQLANGFFGTFISLRVAVEDFGPTLSGLVLSSYFAGFTIGALRCERIIERIGHIRAYAAFAGLVIAATTVMPLLLEPLSWLALRALVGFGSRSRRNDSGDEQDGQAEVERPSLLLRGVHRGDGGLAVGCLGGNSGPSAFRDAGGWAVVGRRDRVLHRGVR